MSRSGGRRLLGASSALLALVAGGLAIWFAVGSLCERSTPLHGPGFEDGFGAGAADARLQGAGSGRSRGLTITLLLRDGFTGQAVSGGAVAELGPHGPGTWSSLGSDSTFDVRSAMAGSEGDVYLVRAPGYQSRQVRLPLPSASTESASVVTVDLIGAGVIPVLVTASGGHDEARVVVQDAHTVAPAREERCREQRVPLGVRTPIDGLVLGRSYLVEASAPGFAPRQGTFTATTPDGSPATLHLVRPLSGKSVRLYGEGLRTTCELLRVRVARGDGDAGDSVPYWNEQARCAEALVFIAPSERQVRVELRGPLGIVLRVEDVPVPPTPWLEIRDVDLSLAEIAVRVPGSGDSQSPMEIRWTHGQEMGFLSLGEQRVLQFLSAPGVKAARVDFEWGRLVARGVTLPGDRVIEFREGDLGVVLVTGLDSTSQPASLRHATMPHEAGSENDGTALSAASRTQHELTYALPPGRYEVVVGERAVGTPFALRSGAKVRVDLRELLRVGSLVVGTPAHASPGAGPVGLTEIALGIIQHGRLRTLRRSEVAQGEDVEFAGLAPGTYVITATSSLGVATREVDVPACDEIRVDLTDFASSRRCTFSVIDEDGNPVPGVDISFREIPFGATQGQTATTDASGSIQIDLSGKLDVLVSVEGVARQIARSDLASPIVLTVARGRSSHVRLVGPDAGRVRGLIAFRPGSVAERGARVEGGGYAFGMDIETPCWFVALLAPREGAVLAAEGSVLVRDQEVELHVAVSDVAVSFDFSEEEESAPPHRVYLRVLGTAAVEAPNLPFCSVVLGEPVASSEGMIVRGAGTIRVRAEGLNTQGLCTWASAPVEIAFASGSTRIELARVNK